MEVLLEIVAKTGAYHVRWDTVIIAVCVTEGLHLGSRGSPILRSRDFSLHSALSESCKHYRLKKFEQKYYTSTAPEKSHK